MSVLVVFGSEHDSIVYNRVLFELREKKIRAEMRICSAHRTPENLVELVRQTSAEIILAGAGLSAALPGVIAAHTIKPVVGIPVESNYSGLDALLSIHQMPAGIPVLGVGVNNVREACNAVELALTKHSKVKLLNPFEENSMVGERLSEARELLRWFGVEFEVVESSRGFEEDECVVINLHRLGNPLPDTRRALVVNVPMNPKSKAVDALALLRAASRGLWVGLNRVENACIAAVQLLNIDCSFFSRKLEAFREKQKHRALMANEAIRNEVV